MLLLWFVALRARCRDVRVPTSPAADDLPTRASSGASVLDVAAASNSGCPALGTGAGEGVVPAADDVIAPDGRLTGCREFRRPNVLGCAL
mmetsp:Transcript_107985/g.214521  ORF Transcript_107985/g.214521 Transcript_107985/m.214521 type:complete len:90 (-) Transcript_107985:94-363(-)